jgi:arylsulfatase A-like enzyme
VTPSRQASHSGASLTPRLTVSPGLATWDSSRDVWELYNLKADFSQSANLAAVEPERLAAMRALFLRALLALPRCPVDRPQSP